MDGVAGGDPGGSSRTEIELQSASQSKYTFDVMLLAELARGMSERQRLLFRTAAKFSANLLEVKCLGVEFRN